MSVIGINKKLEYMY